MGREEYAASEFFVFMGSSMRKHVTTKVKISEQMTWQVPILGMK